MKYSKTLLEGVIICEPDIHLDKRGYFYESFKDIELSDFLGYKVNFCQDNYSFSKYGVIRGLHTNILNYAQSKLVNVLSGEILDVVVDFRKGSKTFGKSFSIKLNDTNKKQVYVPKGFLHGFSVLSKDGANVNIKIDDYFAPNASIGVKYNDALLNIDWELPFEDISLSDADNILNDFNKVDSPFIYLEKEKVV